MLRERLEERFGGLDRRELAGLAVVAVLIVAGVAFWYVRSLPSRIRISTATEAGPAQPGPAGGPPAGPTPSPAAEVVVDVAGWVRHPGVYRLHVGDRVIDAIDLAGGAKPRADLTSLNLAALLTDGEQIIVYRIGSAGAAPPGGGSTIITGSGAGTSGASGSGDLVNLNTATLDQLESLPGIGPVLAQKILDYRTEHGPFKTIEGLMDVSGIGDKRFAELKPHITV